MNAFNILDLYPDGYRPLSSKGWDTAFHSKEYIENNKMTVDKWNTSVMQPRSDVVELYQTANDCSMTADMPRKIIPTSNPNVGLEIVSESPNMVEYNLVGDSPFKQKRLEAEAYGRMMADAHRIKRDNFAKSPEQEAKDKILAAQLQEEQRRIDEAKSMLHPQDAQIESIKEANIETSNMLRGSMYKSGESEEDKSRLDYNMKNYPNVVSSEQYHSMFTNGMPRLSNGKVDILNASSTSFPMQAYSPYQYMANRFARPNRPDEVNLTSRKVKILRQSPGNMFMDMYREGYSQQAMPYEYMYNPFMQANYNAQMQEQRTKDEKNYNALLKLLSNKANGVDDTSTKEEDLKRLKQYDDPEPEYFEIEECVIEAQQFIDHIRGAYPGNIYAEQEVRNQYIIQQQYQQICPPDITSAQFEEVSGLIIQQSDMRETQEILRKSRLENAYDKDAFKKLCGLDTVEGRLAFMGSKSIEEQVYDNAYRAMTGAPREPICITCPPEFIKKDKELRDRYAKYKDTIFAPDV